MVGLGNADDTSDVNKPLSNATTTALHKLADEVKDSLNDTTKVISSSIPIGSIIAHTGTGNAQGGFVLCDGAEYDRIGAFEKLFAVIGTTYGKPLKRCQICSATTYLTKKK